VLLNKETVNVNPNNTRFISAILYARAGCVLQANLVDLVLWVGRGQCGVAA
jgi:hypothetical protein